MIENSDFFIEKQNTGKTAIWQDLWSRVVAPKIEQHFKQRYSKLYQVCKRVEELSETTYENHRKFALCVIEKSLLEDLPGKKSGSTIVLSILDIFTLW